MHQILDLRGRSLRLRAKLERKAGHLRTVPLQRNLEPAGRALAVGEFIDPRIRQHVITEPAVKRLEQPVLIGPGDEVLADFPSAIFPVTQPLDSALIIEK